MCTHTHTAQVPGRHTLQARGECPASRGGSAGPQADREAEGSAGRPSGRRELDDAAPPTMTPAVGPAEPALGAVYRVT